MGVRDCTFDDCSGAVIARGLCGGHYAQWHSGKVLVPLGSWKKTFEQRFWEKVQKTDNCWLWIGAKNPGGYGMILKEQRRELAHRLAFEMKNGPVPDGIVVDHICRNRSCVNQDHLRLASTKQNSENRAGPQRTNVSGFLGVNWSSSRGKWVARVNHHGKRHHLGYFDTPEKAGEVARLKRIELFTHNDKDREARLEMSRAFQF